MGYNRAMKTDLIIIGAGPAGLTAGIYAKRAGLNVAIIEKFAPGGQMTLTSSIENYPGFEKIDGFELSQKMHDQAEKLGCEFIFEDAVSISAVGEEKKVITTTGEHFAKTLIIASGATARKLGLDGEDSLIGKGISYCATCDGALFKGKEVAVVGGGNTALEDSMYLSRFAKKVYLIHRRDEFRGDDILVKELKEKAGSIEVLYSSVVQKLIYSDKLNGIELKNIKTGEVTNLSLDGLFVAIGRRPDTELTEGQIKTDEGGYVIVDDQCKTSAEGVFAAGDVTNSDLKQIVTACAQGAIAGNAAARYVRK